MHLQRMSSEFCNRLITNTECGFTLLPPHFNHTVIVFGWLLVVVMLASLTLLEIMKRVPGLKSPTDAAVCILHVQFIHCLPLGSTV